MAWGRKLFTVSAKIQIRKHWGKLADGRYRINIRRCFFTKFILQFCNFLSQHPEEFKKLNGHSRDDGQVWAKEVHQEIAKTQEIYYDEFLRFRLLEVRNNFWEVSPGVYLIPILCSCRILPLCSCPLLEANV